MIIKKKNNQGTTLIETLIYLGLFAMLLGGAVVAAYSLIEGGGRGQAKVLMQEEGNFLVSKINWVLSGVESVQEPAINTSGPKLSVTKWDTSLNPVIVELSGADMVISKSGSAPLPLNNTNVAVSDLNFAHSFSGGINPQSVRFSFVLTGRAPNGMLIKQSFSGEKFIRK